MGERKSRASIQSCAEEIKAKIDKKRKPSLKFPKRSLSNVAYDEEEGYFKLKEGRITRTLTYNTVKTFAQTLRMMALAKEAIDAEEEVTKREAYYVSKNWGEARFDEQPESDTVMEDIEALFRVNREQLGFIPEEKGGEVAGELSVVDRDRTTGKKVKIDCTKFGSGAYSVPISVEELEFQTKADFVLAIETAGMFQRLNNHSFWRTVNCILVSMGGVPTRACRRFIRRLSEENSMPVYAFVDGDPYGYGNIYRTLKVGSGNAAHINEFFCVPEASFLGVTPDDIDAYDLPTHPLTARDVKRAKDLIKNDPFFRHHKPWQKAIKKMLKMGVRVEQQAFAKHSLNFVLENYLPEKLAQANKFLP
ncbi:MAG: DNA topoisomerase IV subunit A [Planctomycetota bacterium]|jgi:DNA topoisomerase-6 subunit A